MSHRDLTLKEKIAIIRECQNPGKTQVAVAKQFSVSKSTVSKIVKRR